MPKCNTTDRTVNKCLIRVKLWGFTRKRTKAISYQLVFLAMECVQRLEIKLCKFDRSIVIVCTWKEYSQFASTCLIDWITIEWEEALFRAPMIDLCAVSQEKGEYWKWSSSVAMKHLGEGEWFFCTTPLPKCRTNPSSSLLFWRHKTLAIAYIFPSFAMWTWLGPFSIHLGCNDVTNIPAESCCNSVLVIM